KAASTTLLDANGSPQATTRDRAIAGDLIHYNSTNESVYIYGDRHDVTIAQQGSLGQPTSYARGKVVIYNLKTKNVNVEEPKGFPGRRRARGQRPPPHAPRAPEKGKPNPPPPAPPAAAQRQGAPRLQRAVSRADGPRRANGRRSMAGHETRGGRVACPRPRG